MPGEPDSPAGYDDLARAAEDGELDPQVSPWGDSHFQRLYAWPGTHPQVPDVDGRDVLLAGCGRGDHVDWFRERGATVTGVDASADATAAARRDHPDADFAVVDLEAGLPFADGVFDVVCSNLVLSHVADWPPVLASFERVLRPGGALAFATIHPEYHRRKWGLERYADKTRRVVDWGVADVPAYYRPLSTMLNAVADAGFVVERVAEPTPTDAYADANPERYEAAMEAPQVLVVRARTRTRD
jgi:SAM-dependent methyltransferase